MVLKLWCNDPEQLNILSIILLQRQQFIMEKHEYSAHENLRFNEFKGKVVSPKNEDSSY